MMIPISFLSFPFWREKRISVQIVDFQSLFFYCWGSSLSLTMNILLFWKENLSPFLFTLWLSHFTFFFLARLVLTDQPPLSLSYTLFLSFPTPSSKNVSSFIFALPCPCNCLPWRNGREKKEEREMGTRKRMRGFSSTFSQERNPETKSVRENAAVDLPVFSSTFRQMRRKEERIEEERKNEGEEKRTEKRGGGWRGRKMAQENRIKIHTVLLPNFFFSFVLSLSWNEREKRSSSKSEKILFSLLEILCYARLWLTVLLSHYPFFFPDSLS